MQIFQMMMHFIVQYKNIFIFKNTDNMIKRFKHGTLSNAWWYKQIFQSTVFHLKAQISSLVKILSVVFLKVMGFSPRSFLPG